MNLNLDIIIKIASFIGSLGVIIASLKVILSKAFKPLNDKIDIIDKNQCHNYLVDFLSDKESGLAKNEFQITRAYEVYDHYTKDLKGNSYIHDKWEKLMKGE
ncbi:MAG: hypothetical protein RSB71_03025 [Bacilli bacterium]